MSVRVPAILGRLAKHLVRDSAEEMATVEATAEEMATV
jgi:hypothetical protein